MKNTVFDCHTSLERLHINCEEPRAYFIPYESEKKAIEDNRGRSAYFTSLCGDWNFAYIPSLCAAGGVQSLACDELSFEKLSVPMSWQYALGRNYDTPDYINKRYPFPIDPPNIPKDIPTGVYERTVKIEQNELKNREIFLNFEGVDSCFYLFINGNFVGYSQVSHCISEFNVTPYLTAGENSVRVIVLKWCEASYLEDQDKFRLSGIFREVYLLSRPQSRIKDIEIKAKLDEGLTCGSLEINTVFVGNPTAKYKLLSPDGRCALSGELCEQTLAELNAPLLWCDELPTLYTLCVFCEGEYLSFPVGFRRIEIKDKAVLVNGKKIKAKGVNRHDSSALLGAAVSYSSIEQDLLIMKRNNINFLRTSHYPSDPRMPRLCDRLGIYLCAENDLEAHGLQPIGQWHRLTDDPAWEKEYLDRAQRLYERDKNHPCILMWSMGNEAGTGRNHRKIYEYLHSRSPECIVHSEEASRYYTEKYRAGELASPECDYIDIESRMYPSEKICVEDYLSDESGHSKPFFMCEYSHAMGNSSGCLEDYWRLIYSNDSFFGGCVWEFADHSVAAGDRRYSSPEYLYGGDFGQLVHDDNYCMDGLMYPDRREHMGMKEYKQVLRPCRLVGADAESNTVTLRNMRYFKSLSDADLYCSLELDGKTAASGRIACLDIEPQSEKSFLLPFSLTEYKDAHTVCLNLSLRSNTPFEWADVGHELGFEQVILLEKRENAPLPDASGVSVCRNGTEISVNASDTEYIISTSSGLIEKIISRGKNLLSSPITPTVWRAPLDNDRRQKAKIEKAGFERASVWCTSCGTLEEEGKLQVASDFIIGSKGELPILTMTLTYCFHGDGSVVISSRAQVCEGLPPLPRFGIEFTMPEDCERFTYFGLGPYESYPDKRRASRLGIFDTTATENFEHYLKPQENMAHADTRWAHVSSPFGHGLMFLCVDAPYSINCSHYPSRLLGSAAHSFELKPIKETAVVLDYRHNGIGSNSCGPELDKRYRLSEGNIEFGVRIKPALVSDESLFEEMYRK